jgi:lysine 2,3-aminomutase
MFPNDSLSNWASGKGIWSGVSDDDWNDWRWQMRNRLQTKDDFEKFIQLTDEELEGFKIAENKLSVAVTPYFFNLLNKKHADCPLRRQVMPSSMEALHSEDEMLDPVGEESSMIAPGIVHRYPDRVLFLVTDRCAAYCRYCTRSRLVSNAQGYGFHPQIEESIKYIASNDSIRDVLISGGDPLMLSDQKLETLLSRLSEIPHVEFVRFGTRIPVFLPQRITDSLVNALGAQSSE